MGDANISTSGSIPKVACWDLDMMEETGSETTHHRIGGKGGKGTPVRFWGTVQFIYIIQHENSAGLASDVVVCIITARGHHVLVTDASRAICESPNKHA